VPEEETRVAVLVSGAIRPPHWSDETPDWDIWDVKGLAETLLDVLGGGTVEPLGDADPGRLALDGELVPTTRLALRRDGALIGVAGQVAEDAID
ncbi:MAG: hypothetical protein GWM90_25145, partial [Gemmatimonadetes bacterium]|nr:hypothetical protein [Gemmatimonadota bacterium]NIQ54507.1 hypothetical protein [Gemmatimonadota bacterium]NIU74239.1 hypothetical protein [Gammaproteobacteria bacterium]NIX47242.1 hypothetical protein [Gemmatimonadota bacterium]